MGSIIPPATGAVLVCLSDVKLTTLCAMVMFLCDEARRTQGGLGKVEGAEHRGRACANCLAVGQGRKITPTLSPVVCAQCAYAHQTAYATIPEAMALSRSIPEVLFVLLRGL
jgi:hypothetical protein